MASVKADPNSFLSSFGKKAIFFFACTMQLVGSYFLNLGLNPGPLQWKHRVLTTGPLEIQKKQFFEIYFNNILLKVT